MAAPSASWTLLLLLLLVATGEAATINITNRCSFTVWPAAVRTGGGRVHSRPSQTDFFDISLVDGFNVPMDFLPVPTPGAPACRKGPRCAANITSQCPAELRAPGGCNNACNVLKQSKYCCTETNASCEPSTYSLLFVRMCPDAYSYPLDDSSSTVFTCPTGTNYQVVFCPPLDTTMSSPPNPPAPVATGPTSIVN